MGAIFSLFRKKASTKDKLEEIEKEINDIEDFGFYTQRRRKHLIGSFVLYSIVLYIISIIVFYFVYFPSETKQQLLYSLPFLVFPFFIWLSKWLLQMYYACKLERGEDKLVELQRRKKRLLEEVMDKEPYKIAKEILERYDPDRAKKDMMMASSASQMMEMLKKQEEIAKLTSQLRHRASIGTSRPSVPPPKLVPQVAYRSPQAMSRVMPTRPQLVGSPTALVVGRALPMPAMPQQGFVTMRSRGMPFGAPTVRPTSAGRPKPTLFDRLVEYVVGDGPSNRYALICSNCWSHNGMALMEEFEYMSFRCRDCGFPNHARKMRPQAPVLPSLMPSPSKDRLSTSDNSVSTSTDTEEEGELPSTSAEVGHSSESCGEDTSRLVITELECSSAETGQVTEGQVTDVPEAEDSQIISNEAENIEDQMEENIANIEENAEEMAATSESNLEEQEVILEKMPAEIFADKVSD